MTDEEYAHSACDSAVRMSPGLMCGRRGRDTDTARLTAIGEQALYTDSPPEQMVLPEGLLTIGSKASADSGVTAMNLPDSLTFIADDAFDGTAITTLTVNEGTCAQGWAVSHRCSGWEYEEMSDGTVSINGFTRPVGTVTIPGRSGFSRPILKMIPAVCKRI